MSVFSYVHAFCETIRDRVTIPVLLGRPDSAVPGLYVWPWRMEINAECSNDRPRPPMGEGRFRPAPKGVGRSDGDTARLKASPKTSFLCF